MVVNGHPHLNKAAHHVRLELFLHLSVSLKLTGFKTVSVSYKFRGKVPAQCPLCYLNLSYISLSDGFTMHFSPCAPSFQLVRFSDYLIMKLNVCSTMLPD